MARVGRLAHQVELVGDGVLEFAHHFAQVQERPLRERALEESGERVEERDILGDHLADVGPQDLHGHVAAVVERGEMHLRDRGARDGRLVDGAKDFRVRPAVGAVERRRGAIPGEGRNVVLQLRELVGDVLGNEVAAHREELAELHEHRSQGFEREPQALATRA